MITFAVTTFNNKVKLKSSDVKYSNIWTLNTYFEKGKFRFQNIIFKVGDNLCIVLYKK